MSNQPATRVIELETVIYNPWARNGTWCKAPYPNHPKGCPNYKRCLSNNPDFRTLFQTRSPLGWYAVVDEFDLEAHAAHMKAAHPTWSGRQCRNPLYWQGKVMKRLREAAEAFLASSGGGTILEIPEACGVEVFETMAKAGVILERTPRIVRKVMLVGMVRAPCHT